MNHFQSAGCGQEIVAVGSHRFRRSHQQNGTQAFSPRQQAVFHGIVHVGDAPLFHAFFQKIVNQLFAGVVVLLKVHLFLLLLTL